MVPVVKDSDSKGLTEIGSAVKALAGKVNNLNKSSLLLFCPMQSKLAYDIFTAGV